MHLLSSSVSQLGGGHRVLLCVLFGRCGASHNKGTEVHWTALSMADDAWSLPFKMQPSFLVPSPDQSSEPPGGTSKMKSPTPNQGLRIPRHRAQNVYHQKAPCDPNARPKLGTAGHKHTNPIKDQCFLQWCFLWPLEMLKTWLMPDRRLVNSSVFCPTSWTWPYSFPSSDLPIAVNHGNKKIYASTICYKKNPLA